MKTSKPAFTGFLLKLLASLLVAGMAFISFAHAQEVTILMSEELDEKNNMLPLAPEIIDRLHAVEAAAGLKFDIRRYPWKRALINVENGEGLVFGISKTPERLRRFTFSEAVMSDVAWLVTSCDASFPFSSVNDLKGKTIGVVRGTSYGQEFDAQSNVLFKVEDDTNSNPARLRKLLIKRTDAIVIYSSNLEREALEATTNKQYSESQTAAGEHGAGMFCILPRPVSVQDVHFAVRPDLDKGIIKKLNAAIAATRKPGNSAQKPWLPPKEAQ